jgi:hypothetical protein
VARLIVMAVTRSGLPDAESHWSLQKSPRPLIGEDSVIHWKISRISTARSWQPACTIRSQGQGDMYLHDSQFDHGEGRPPEFDANQLETLRRHPLGTFDDFAQMSGSRRGVKIGALAVGAILTVWTAHSCYRFTIVDPITRAARVTGGSLFTEPTDVRIDGATIGGSMIKAGWVGAGLRMEFTVGVRRITTSRVKFLSVEGASFSASVA